LSQIVVFCTVPGLKLGRLIAKSLLKRKLAACVNITSPVESHYQWQGGLCCDREFLLIIKARLSTLRKIEKAIKKIHTYSVPEIIALPIKGGSKDYLIWLTKETIA